MMKKSKCFSGSAVVLATVAFFAMGGSDLMAAASGKTGKGMTVKKASSQSIWKTDFKAAQELATKEKKPMLLFFTGSDWCGWCIRLNREVLSKPEFTKWASANVVPVELDFPRNPDPTLQKQNNELMAKYGVRGYPTLVLINADGTEFARTGYRAGGAAKYVALLQELLKKAK